MHIHVHRYRRTLVSPPVEGMAATAIVPKYSKVFDSKDLVSFMSAESSGHSCLKHQIPAVNVGKCRMEWLFYIWNMDLDVLYSLHSRFLPLQVVSYLHAFAVGWLLPCLFPGSTMVS